MCAALRLCKSWTLTLSVIRFEAMESLSEVLSAYCKIKKPKRNRKESRRTVRKLSPLGQVRKDDGVGQMAVKHTISRCVFRTEMTVYPHSLILVREKERSLEHLQGFKV